MVRHGPDCAHSRRKIHEFNAGVGGRFCVSLTYQDASTPGKSSVHTDTHNGRFEDNEPGWAMALEQVTVSVER